MELTDEKKSQIIEAYKRGDKTTLIQLEYGIGPGGMYRVLHQANVPLRSRDPNHPASSMEVRRQAKLLLKVPTVKKLIQLSHEEVAYFKEQFDDKVKRYGPDSAWDAHTEVAIEYYDELVDRLNIWIATLGDDAGGIVLGLVAFKESIEAIRKLCPEEEDYVKQETTNLEASGPA